MKAAYITSLGGPDVLTVGTLPSPKLGFNETLIRVKAVGLNWLDVLLRTEDFGLAFPHIPGSDVVGIVEETDSPKLKRGEIVVINPAIPCSKCDKENENADVCKFVRILGVHCPGGYGSYLTVPNEQIYKLPDGISTIEAAAFPLDYLTAWRMLVTKANLQRNESVLIWGASGALGTAAIRIAKSLGATIFAAVGSKIFIDDLLSLGVDHVILYKTENVVDCIKKVTHGIGVDCVFESVGASTFQISINAVRPHGRIVICGTRSGNTTRINLEDLYYNQIRIFGSRMGIKSEFEQVLSHISKPEWKPVIAAEMAIDDVRKAHSLLENRTKIGKVILRHE